MSLMQKGKHIELDQAFKVIPNPIIILNKEYTIKYANQSAELFFAESIPSNKKNLKNFLSKDNIIFSFIDQVFNYKYSATQYDVVFSHFNNNDILIDLNAAIYDEDYIILSIHKRAMAQQIDRSTAQKGITHSISGLSSLLAHEIKNPLSGIKGAAQLLGEDASDEDKELTEIIGLEVDRIGSLVKRVGNISDKRSIQRTSVNIHDVLKRVYGLAINSFASNCEINELYDPSLPNVYGDLDSLVQVFLNLVKNAAESDPNGKINIITGYRHGFSVQVSGNKSKLRLPILIQIEDIGPGIPESIRTHLFEPFVSTKSNGSGLGLSLVANVIDEHGGIIEVNSSNNKTVFTVLLPSFVDQNK